MLKLNYSNRVYFSTEDISKTILKEIRKAFTHSNPRFFKMKNMGRYYFNIPAKIATWEYNEENNKFSVARGGMNRLTDILDDNRIEYNIVDNSHEVKLKPNTFLSTNNFVYRDEQVAAANALTKSGGGLIRGVCGCGKTEILLLAIQKFNQKSLVMVHTQKLMEQWIERIKLRWGFQDHQIGKIGGGYQASIADITIGMIQTLTKNVYKYAKEFGLVALDEAHHAPATTFQNVVDAFYAKYRAGASATIRRKDGLEFLTHDEFGPIVFEITNKEMVEAKRLHDVEIIVVPTDFEFTDYDIEEELVLTSSGEYRKIKKKKINWTKLLNQIVEDTDRNNLIFKYLKKEIDNDNYCLLLSDRLEHCFQWKKILAGGGIKAGLLIGGMKHRLEGDHSIKQMKKGELHVVIGSLAYEEFILVKDKRDGFIKFIKIGDLVEKEDVNNYLAWSNHKGEVKFRKIKCGIKHKRKSLLNKIQLAGGAQALITENHSVFTGSERSLRLALPKKNVNIICCNKVPAPSRKLHSINLLDFVQEEEKLGFLISGLDYNFMVKVRNNRNRWAKHTRENEWFRWVKHNVRYYKMRYRTDLKSVKLLKEKHLSKIEIFWKEGKKFIPIIYKTSFHLGRLLGFYVSEGCASSCNTYSRISISAHEDYDGYKGNIRKKIRESINHVFPGIRICETKKCLSLEGVIFYKFFIDFLKCGRLAWNKRIPDIVLNGSNEIKKGFIEGYFLGDGCFRSRKRKFVFTTTSRELVVQLIYLLKSIGCKSISTNQRKIGKRMKHKSYDITVKDLKIKNFEIREVSDKWRLSTMRKNFSGKLIKKNIIKKQPEYVYDISVEEAENFVGGIGLIYMHNSSGVADEGLDIPILNRGFATCPSAGNKFRFEQQTGRLRRLFKNKKDAKFYYFWDSRIPQIEKHLRNIQKQFSKVKVVKR